MANHSFPSEKTERADEDNKVVLDIVLLQCTTHILVIILCSRGIRTPNALGLIGEELKVMHWNVTRDVSEPFLLCKVICGRRE